MRRNRFGINLDEGIPLLTEWEYKNLHVSCNEDSYRSLIEWIKEGYEPLQIGGQIGSGKSSVIQKSFFDSGLKPDIILHFDQEGLNLSIGDFLLIVMKGFCQFALNNDINLSSYFLPKEVASLPENDWEQFLDLLSLKEYRLEAYKRLIKITRNIADNFDYFIRVLLSIGSEINIKLDRPLFIFASGIDKFDTESAAYFSLESIFPILIPHKTLFEVHAVHLFYTKELHLIKYIFLKSMTEETIEKILIKRMGIYSDNVKNEIKVLAQWSGGNPRQAIRLLTYFETAKKNKNNSIVDCISNAVQSTSRDFFAFSRTPDTEVMRYIKKNEKIRATGFSLPGDKDTARMGLYGNWFFITGEAKEHYWPVKINPLVKSDIFRDTFTVEPEVKALQLYAEQHDMSSIGLSTNDTSDISEHNINNRQKFLLYSSFEQPISSNISEILDVIAAALLSKDRSDRIIIAFKNLSLLEASRAYLFAKANTYEYQRYSHKIIFGGKNKYPLQSLMDFLNEDTDIYSIHFKGEFTKEQLRSIDKFRDRLSEYQIIWWIEHNKLVKYLQEWIQLRQLFEVFILDDELLGSLSIKEIENDLKFFEDIVEDKKSSEANLVKNLKIVLKYLRSVQGGTNG